MRPDLGPELVLDAQTAIGTIWHVRRYWTPELLLDVEERFRRSASSLLGQVPSHARLVSGLVRLGLAELDPADLEPVEADVARRIAEALVDDGWIAAGLGPDRELRSIELEQIVASIEHSGAIQTLRVDPSLSSTYTTGRAS